MQSDTPKYTENTIRARVRRIYMYNRKARRIELSSELLYMRSARGLQLLRAIKRFARRKSRDDVRFNKRSGFEKRV